MSTIERRMELLLRSQAFLTVHAAAGEYAEARIHLAARDATEAAIVKEWNAAIKVIGEIINERFVTLPDGKWHCDECDASSGWMEQVHLPDLCIVAYLQHIKAQMEGN